MSIVGERDRKVSTSSRASKSWLNVDTRSLKVFQGELPAGVEDEKGLSIVKCTTRFATAMCIIIAFVKVGLYMKTGSEVVRTSALDSLGDLMANCMTLYTGYRMTRVEPKRYPVGQFKFQSIGCLVFSTFMFALMFGNSLGNIESLIESKDEVGQRSISRFFYQAGNDLGGKFKEWHGEVSYDDKEQKYVWAEDGDKMKNPLISYYKEEAKDPEGKYEQGELEGIKKLSETYEKDNPEVTRGELVSDVAEYNNPVTQREDLIYQNTFLGCCASYKCCLWLYCLCYAIPNSGSSVLVALATDKRNDFIGTFTVITATSLAYLFKGDLDGLISDEKVDPLVSLCLSIFIMYSWSSLMVEHMTILSQESAERIFESGVRELVDQQLQGIGCKVHSEDLRVYVSGEKHTIEVTLTGKADSAHSEVEKVARTLQRKLENMEDVERVLIRMV